MATEKRGPLTLSVLKALDVLECLHSVGTSLPPAEIATRLGVSRPTAYRLLATMANRGWVSKDPQDPGKYRLGYRVLQLAGTFLHELDVRTVARPFMERLSREYDVSVSLFLLDETEIVFIDRVYGSHPLQPFVPIGKRGALHSRAVGKAILAHLPPDKFEYIIRIHGLEARTRRTITDENKLRAEIARVRAQGYGTSNQEDTDALRAVGAAILDFQGAPVGGLAISGLVPDMTDARMIVLGHAIHDTAAQISEQLGCAHMDGHNGTAASG